ncbi:MAG TPA: PfkB family carbohydrate kinase [Candidatus Limnocylindrales bacterium]
MPRGRSRRHPVARSRPRVVVLGDLMLDAVILPVRAPETATDVPGRVSLRQGGSAATTARWFARLGADTTFVCAVGRDSIGRGLVSAVEGDGVRVRATRVSGERTGRIGVIVDPGGERSFVADRAAADRLAPDDLSASTFRADLLHLPAYSLLGEPLGLAGRRAIELARAAGSLVSLDLASVRPLLARGRRAAVRLVEAAAPDVLFATRAEGEALLDSPYLSGLADLVPLAVIKQGRAGATVLARDGESRLTFDVATRPVDALDTTGAGDAFDAGFLVAWLEQPASARSRPAGLRRAVLAAHRAAGRQLANPGRELSL